MAASEVGIPMPVSGVRVIKLIAPELPRLSIIHADCDITDWLMQAEEDCIAGQVDKTQYVMYAEGLPLQLHGITAAVILLKCTTGIAFCSGVN